MTKRTTSVLLVILLCGLLLTTTALTSSSEGYDLSWWTVDSGGGILNIEGGYSLSSTIGQPDAGVLTGGAYTLGGGFWTGGKLAAVYKTYLPLVLRDF
jgi:hypothetical protein